ncbi:unnamed protein product [Ceutorhynchus assimilis]|uniref:G-patch domain-containing protein n=1 Tax=Ceutorhynchus assimilis TaxID=467358 RepID=A0A9P0DJS8_9CUCU|nr:unnamed protein product [Ceutorhynchus assimilis]
MEPPKISFSFTKSFKKTNIILNTATPKENEKKGEVIECLEEQSIKIKDAIIEEARPLVIPLKDDQKNLLDRIKAASKWDKKKEKEDTRPDSELTADELAARQLIREAKARLENGHESNNHKVSVLPLTEESATLTGEKEPTLEDYESVPIGDYGLALLRGMGWKDGMAIGKNVTKSAVPSLPELRPKGLGLGATKIELPEQKATDEDGNELILMKRGFAKVVMGPQNGNYCEVQGFDEEAGRVIVKVYPKGDIININEVMLVPVTKEEFSKGSKILNNAKYEQYRKLSDKKLESFKVEKQKSDSEDSDRSSKATTSAATCSKYSKRSPSSEGELDTSKYSHKNRQSRSRSKDEDSKKSRSNIGMDKSEKGTKKTRSRSNHWLETDRPESRSRSKDRNSRKKYRSKSRSWSKDKKKDDEERALRRRSDKDREKSRSTSEDSYQERKKSRSRSNKDKRKSSRDTSDEDKRESRSRSKKSRNKSKDKISRHSSKHKSSKNRSGSIEKSYSKEKKKKKSSHKSKKVRHSSEDSDRSRSTSKDKRAKNRKSRETSYSSDSDLKKEKRRKNKCKSRHRQASSSDSEDRKYRKKK